MSDVRCQLLKEVPEPHIRLNTAKVHAAVTSKQTSLIRKTWKTTEIVLRVTHQLMRAI